MLTIMKVMLRNGIILEYYVVGIKMDAILAPDEDPGSRRVPKSTSACTHCCGRPGIHDSITDGYMRKHN